MRGIEKQADEVIQLQTFIEKQCELCHKLFYNVTGTENVCYKCRDNRLITGYAATHYAGRIVSWNDIPACFHYLFEERVCKVCKRVFIVKKTSRFKTCSSECSHHYNHNHASGSR